MEENKVQLAPFHALNQFMIPEYRLSIIQKVLTHIDELPANQKGVINAMIRKYVTVPGFRNSALAPVAIKVKGAVNAFERNPEFVIRFLSAWAELNSELRGQVYDFLKERNWEVFPVDTDRTKLPGFFTQWPKEETYDVLDKAFMEKYPEVAFDENDTRLMIVLMGMRLPFEMQEE
jgi:hypothetical protein